MLRFKLLTCIAVLLMPANLLAQDALLELPGLPTSSPPSINLPTDSGSRLPVEPMPQLTAEPAPTPPMSAPAVVLPEQEPPTVTAPEVEASIALPTPTPIVTPPVVINAQTELDSQPETTAPAGPALPELADDTDRITLPSLMVDTALIEKIRLIQRTGINPTSAPETIALAQVPTINYPERLAIRVDTILYADAKSWTAWVNGKRLTSRDRALSNSLQLEDISPNQLVIRWRPESLEVLEEATNRLSGSRLVRHDGRYIYVSLRPNQVFFTATMQVYEGRSLPPSVQAALYQKKPVAAVAIPTSNVQPDLIDQAGQAGNDAVDSLRTILEQGARAIQTE